MLVAIIVAIVILLIGYFREKSKQRKAARRFRRRKKRFADWARKNGGVCVVDTDDCLEFEFPDNIKVKQF